MRFQINTYLLTLLVFSIILLLSFLIAPTIKETAGSFFAGVFFTNSIETADILERFSEATTKKGSDDKIRVMIVPGHDNQHSGAQYNSVREADLTLMVGTELARLLSKEKKLEVLLARNKEGFHPDLATYLEDTEETIEFKEAKMKTMNRLVAKGKVESYVNIHHNTARPEVSAILYGINRYANDHDYDIVLHIHFNDYPGRTGANGTYSGFSMYVPEGQYSNADASYDFAEKLRDQFLLISADSNLPNEEAITEDQELIAIGSYNTLDSAVALIEYGYIYEPQFTTPGVGDVVRKEFARQTYRGIMRYLKDTDEAEEGTFSAFNDFAWERDLKLGDEGVDVLALQDLLHDLGHYPDNEDLNACPLSGYFGECTERALAAYQKDADIDPTGLFGEVTREMLNE